MTKRLILLITLVALSFQIASCTSNKSQEETDVVENADVEKIDAENTLTEEIDSTTAAGEDPAMQEALGETIASNETSATDSGTPEPVLDLPTEVAAAPTLDESSLNDVPADAIANSSSPAEVALDDMPAPAETDPTPIVESSNSAPLIENSADNSALADYSVPEPKKGETLLKLATTMPYQTPKGWVNTVYVARPGETLTDISMKVYAADQTKDLKKIAENSFLKWRAVKPGDKIYYISPNRPDDSTKTILYYEDMGMVPETYVAKKGDNLKKVAKEILGYSNGYIEMWTSNPVESKGKLAEGETLRYWRSASGVTNSTANNSMNAGGAAQFIDPAQAPQMPPPQMANNAMPPPTEMPPPPDSMATLPPPPSMDQQPMPTDPQQMADNSLPPPPPPPPADIAPPPPVEDVNATAKVAPTDPTEEEDTGSPLAGLDNETMTMAAVGILIAALAFTLIRRKKKKAAEMAAAMNETHVGT